VDKRNGQIAQRHHLRSVSHSQAGAIFPKGHIAHIMESILDMPVVADGITYEGDAPRAARRRRMAALSAIRSTATHDGV
jgi:hypothetical protein